MAAGNTDTVAAVVPTGDTLVRPRAPAARLRTQRVTHPALRHWRHREEITLKSH